MPQASSTGWSPMKSKRGDGPRRLETGPYEGSRVRWWNGDAASSSASGEPPSFQYYQHDRTLGGRRDNDAVKLSPVAMSRLYGDKSLERHVEKLFDGLHELCIGKQA